MRYCNNCKKLAAGDPLFCRFCGRTYDCKICPRGHIEPREAEVCSECGSPDLSLPAPPATPAQKLVLRLVRVVPGLLLVGLSLLLVSSFVQALAHSREVQGRLFVLLLLLGVAWFAWTRLPRPFRGLVKRAGKAAVRRRQKERRK